MQITVVGRHFDGTEPIKKYADRKLLRLERFSGKIKEIHVILEVQKFRHIAEISLHLKDIKLMATEESRDMYASIDKAVGNLQKQLSRLTERMKEHRLRRSLRKIYFFGRFFGTPGEPEARQGKKTAVIKREFQPKPMSVEEACLELDLFKENFLVFRNSDTEAINVIYKRDDGDYGLIVPK